MQDLPLAGFDKEARQFVLEQYKRAGIHFHGCSSPSKINKGGDGKLTITVEPYKREGDPFEIDGVDEVSSGGLCMGAILCDGSFSRHRSIPLCLSAVLLLALRQEAGQMQSSCGL